MQDLIILSPCFYPDVEPARLMAQSALDHGLTVQLYGVGEPFIPHGADAQVLKLYEFMSKEALAEYVIVSDCRDVLFLADEDEILEKFKRFNSGVVMSTERACWPMDAEVVSYFYGRRAHGYDFINAGQFMGRWPCVVKALKYLLDHYRTGNGLDNSQGWWARALMRGQLSFELDNGCHIFQTMSAGADGHIRLEYERVRNTLTGAWPCSVHFNGNPNTKEPHRELWNLLKHGK